MRASTSPRRTVAPTSATIEVRTPSRSARSMASSSCRRDSSRSRCAMATSARDAASCTSRERIARASASSSWRSSMSVFFASAAAAERVLLGDQSFGAQRRLLLGGVVDDLRVELLLLDLRAQRGNRLVEAQPQLASLRSASARRDRRAAPPRAATPTVSSVEQLVAGLHAIAGTASDAQHARFDGTGDDLLDQRDDRAVRLAASPRSRRARTRAI